MKDLVDRFNFLDRRWSHSSMRTQKREGERISRFYAQAEMFYLAQAICSQASPEIQDRLNKARRSIMEQVEKGPKDVGGVIHIHRATRQMMWADFQISPEFSVDPSLTGKFISKQSIKALTKAHKDQIHTVLETVRRTLKEG